MRRPPIQLYGQFNSYWSNANVSRGIALGLIQNGVAVRCWDRTGDYLGLPKSPLLSEGMTQGTDCIGGFVGYPHLGEEALRGHDIKIGFFIAESSVIPLQWAQAAVRCDLVVTPSTWTKLTFARAGVDPGKLLVAPHGLAPIFAEAACIIKSDPLTEIPLKFLHIAGARDFIERKGTPLLIKAFVAVARRREYPIQLHIRTPMSAQIENLRVTEDPEGKYILMDYHDMPLSPTAMVGYLSRGWAALVQPSRAEAFGICPLEARACGIPVILTAGHGHCEHLESSDTLIPMGSDQAIRVNGIPGGVAPGLDQEAIESSLESFLGSRTLRTAEARRLMGSYYEQHSWEKVMRPVADWVKKVNRSRGRTLLEKL